jgi:8-oxo-dGTP pyrophosphatase MutT (NUDIX family)
MASTWVFPGGKVDRGETDGLAALREVLEEAGVLLVPGATADQAEVLRERWQGRTGSFTTLLKAIGLPPDPALLVPFAHWITPSAEPRRFSAQFFVAELPAGQTATHDSTETTEHVWLTPQAAIAAREKGELALPPPTLRTLVELADYADVAALLAAVRARGAHPTVLPKLVERDGGVVLVLPWDADYASTPGEGCDFPPDHPLRRTPSRIELPGIWWR